MFSTNDTIVAIATPPGRGAIGVVRLSGPHAQDIASQLLRIQRPLPPRLATLARLSAHGVSDDVVATFFPGPRSYTGDDVLELSAHGSDAVLHAIVEAAVARGARLARPGEFTLRAYLNGKLDLVQAEAVADLIEAATPLQARAAFEQLDGTLTAALAGIDQALFELEAELEASVDFPDEGYHFIDPPTLIARLRSITAGVGALLTTSERGRVIRDGVRVVIAGPPNVGKSRLFNALVGANRSIVSTIAGTTRDMVTESVDLQGLRVTLVDTAGLVESADPIEREGVTRARGAADNADLVIVVADGSVERTDSSIAIPAERCVCVASKSDLPQRWSDPRFLPVSAESGDGLEALASRICVTVAGDERLKDTPTVSNLRHIALLEQARGVLTRLLDGLIASGVPSEEFVLLDLCAARQCLAEIAGRRGDDEMLEHIFARFCIGK